MVIQAVNVPETEHECNLLSAEVLDWCVLYYNTINPSVDVIVEGTIAVLTGRTKRLIDRL